MRLNYGEFPLSRGSRPGDQGLRNGSDRFGIFGDVFIVNMCFHNIFTFLYNLKEKLETLKEQSRTSLVAQMVKRLSTMQETWVRSLVREDSLEKEMVTHSSTLA